ncbi:MAG: MinD/ParA family protein [Thioalkalivibrionaceae bacterium]
MQMIAVASGKGGVGKTNVAVNLAVAFAKLGRKVLLLDADLGLANVDVLLGLKPERTLHDLISGRVTSVDEVVTAGPEGIDVIASASGIAEMANLSQSEHAGLVRAFERYQRPVDLLLVDTAAGVQDSVTRFCAAVHQVVVVVNDEPASLTDAYALIKVLFRDHDRRNFYLLPNNVADLASARRVEATLARVCSQYLPEVTITRIGAVPHDEQLRRAVQRRKPVLTLAPSASSSRALFEAAQTLMRLPALDQGVPGIGFFVERLLLPRKPKPS